MAETAPVHRLAYIMEHDSLDTTLLYLRGTRREVQWGGENIAWV